jgi:hypothetical protein
MRRTLPFMFSTGFVVEKERVSVAERPSPITVSVSSRPSRRDAAALGYFFFT